MKTSKPQLRLAGTEAHRRVNFFSNHSDRTIMVAALLGWKIRDIAALVGMSPGQVYYRAHKLLKISVSKYRGESKLSRGILKHMQETTLMKEATTDTLRAADVTPKLDVERKILRA